MINKLTSLLKTQTLKDSAVSFFGHIGSALINLVFFALVTRRLGPQAFGIFALCMTTTYLIKDFADIALDSALLKFVPASHPPVARGFLKQIFTIKLLYAAAFILIGITFRHPLSQLVFKFDLPTLIILSTIWSLSQSIMSFITTTFQARKQFFHASIFISAVSTVRLLLLFITLGLNIFSVASLIIISFTADFITISVGLTFIGLRFLHAHPSAKTNRRIFKFGLPMLATSLSGILSDKLNVYLTNYYTTAAEVGLLSAASRLFTPVQSLTGSLSRVFGSRHAGFPHHQSARTYLYKTLSLAAILAAGLIFTSLFAHPMIFILYGSEFLSATLVFQILTFGYGIFLLLVPLNSYLLYYLGRSDIMGYLSIVQLIITIVTNLALIPPYGITGAAGAFVLTMLTSLLLTGLLCKLSQPIKH